MTQHTRSTATRATLAWLEQLEVAEGRTHNCMALFPVFGDAESSPPLSYRVLGEALAEGWAEVSEQPTPTVPQLVLTNKGEAMLFVMDGEEIVGGKQNRIANASFLVAPGARVTLPVTCVEHGRWHGSSPRFSAGEASYHSLRRTAQESVRASLRTSSRPVADQADVWAELSRRHAAARSDSPTEAMHDLYRTRGASLSDYERAFPHPEGCLGLIVALDGRVTGADLFDQTRTASVLWPKLVRSYAMDVLDGERGPAVDHDQAVALLTAALGARSEVYPSLGLGEDVRLEGEGVAGAALVHQSRPVHVSLFRVDGPTGAGRATTRLVRASTRRRFRAGSSGQ